MYRFIFAHPRILAFGLLLTLFSSFGQTFLISVFVPRILEAFSLSSGAFGTLYAAATLTSAFCLPFFGRLIDRVPLQRFTLAVGFGLVLSCFAMSLSWNVASLFVAILGLRLTGQGLLSLTASTTMARSFEQGRGKALSVSAMGYPLGEGLLPMLVVLLVHVVGWRSSWAILGAGILLILLLAVFSLLSKEPSARPVLVPKSERARNPALFRDPLFYLILPGNLFLPLVLTALFLYQIPLGESRGWSVATMASAFVGFAIARLLTSLAIGLLIDRWSAMRVFPFILLPVIAGLAVVWGWQSPWAVYFYLALAGFSQGIAGPVMSAMWAEVYGVESLGATKGTVSTIGILATAIGPVALGLLLDAGVSFEAILQGCLVLGFGSVATSFVAKAFLAKREPS